MKKKRVKGRFLMTTGVLCLLAAAVLAGYYLVEEQRSNKAAQDVLELLDREIHRTAATPAPAEEEQQLFIADGNGLKVDWPLQEENVPMPWPVDEQGIPEPEVTDVLGRVFRWNLTANRPVLLKVEPAAQRAQESVQTTEETAIPAQTTPPQGDAAARPVASAQTTFPISRPTNTPVPPAQTTPVQPSPTVPGRPTPTAAQLPVPTPATVSPTILPATKTPLPTKTAEERFSATTPPPTDVPATTYPAPPAAESAQPSPIVTTPCPAAPMEPLQPTARPVSTATLRPTPTAPQEQPQHPGSSLGWDEPVHAPGSNLGEDEPIGDWDWQDQTGHQGQLPSGDEAIPTEAPPSTWSTSADGGLMPFVSDGHGQIIPWMTDANGVSLSLDALMAIWDSLVSQLTLNWMSLLNQPDFVRNPTMEMPVTSLNGYDYIGIVEIPSQKLSLPVMSTWNYTKLRISPCRYKGSIYNGDAILAGHNNSRHFSPIKKLIVGDEVRFTDTRGNVFIYSVTQIQSLGEFDVADMLEGAEVWDLTLFTCSHNSRRRYTVRCVLEEYIVAE